LIIFHINKIIIIFVIEIIKKNIYLKILMGIGDWGLGIGDWGLGGGGWGASPQPQSPNPQTPDPKI